MDLFCSSPRSGRKFMFFNEESLKLFNRSLMKQNNELIRIMGIEIRLPEFKSYLLHLVTLLS